MDKRLLVVLLIVVFVFSGMATAYAEKCDMSKMGKMGKMGMSNDSKKGMGNKKDMGLDKKILMKAKFFLDKSQDLELSDDQIAMIKTLKIDVKKEVIKQNADIEIIGIDIDSAMYAKKIDTGAINDLIDKKYDTKKAKAKYLVEKYAQLKGILTAKQTDTLKELWKKCKMS